jgi:hypothetical protein
VGAVSPGAYCVSDGYEEYLRLKEEHKRRDR